ncbi:hypothetical protein ES705_20294 [subsurface metagenome]
MNEKGIVSSKRKPHLSYRFKERLAFNISDGAAYFNDDYIVFVSYGVKSIFYLVSDMRNNLDCFAEVFSLSFFSYDRFVNFSRCPVMSLGRFCRSEPFIMPQIKVCFRSVICDIHFSMLEGIHGAWIHVKIRIEFLDSYFVAVTFQ